MSNEQVVRDACRVIWSEGEVSRVGEFYAEDFQADYPFTDWGKGLEGVEALASSMRESFPDYREEIEELISADDLVIVRLKIRGTHLGPLVGFPATGKTVEFRDMTILRLRDGKIIEQRGLSDLLTVYLQLGLIQPPTADGGAADG